MNFTFVKIHLFICLIIKYFPYNTVKKKKLYILINLLSIINSKGRFYYNAKFLNAQILSHQLTIINNTPKKKPLINRQYLFHAMLKKNNKRLFTLLQPFNQLISQSYCSRQRWLVPMWRRPLAIFSWQ